MALGAGWIGDAGRCWCRVGRFGGYSAASTVLCRRIVQPGLIESRPRVDIPNEIDTVDLAARVFEAWWSERNPDFYPYHHQMTAVPMPSPFSLPPVVGITRQAAGRNAFGGTVFLGLGEPDTAWTPVAHRPVALADRPLVVFEDGWGRNPYPATPRATLNTAIAVLTARDAATHLDGIADPTSARQRTNEAASLRTWADGLESYLPALSRPWLSEMGAGFPTAKKPDTARTANGRTSTVTAF